MTDTPFRCVLDLRAALGESPTWSIDEQALYFVDIVAPALIRFDPATGAHTATAMPSSIGCFGLRERGGFVVALRDGIWLADAHGRLEHRLAGAPYDPAHHRFNDGRVDRQGRFWVGSMNEKRDAPSAALYRLERDGSLARVLDGVTVSNGVAWSPDGRTMYHADTPAHTVRAYDFDPATGVPSGGRVFARWHGDTDRPDGAAVDSAGNYWIAFFRGGKVLQVSPQGRVLREVPFPAQCPTMPCFGGPDLRTLYVTSARKDRPADELARYPQSGGLFAMRVEVPGLPEPRFAGG
ncbi:MAG TPA: SMP-30/gluconolactonase/LRE family protein [Casimicrobiaceae bacterium]|nr:SMP-30/gluconolactonase/LRE family protein [Casimicrobiaceae bacterium]